jgi:hypothetical protein
MCAGTGWEGDGFDAAGYGNGWGRGGGGPMRGGRGGRGAPFGRQGSGFGPEAAPIMGAPNLGPGQMLVLAPGARRLSSQYFAQDMGRGLFSWPCNAVHLHSCTPDLEALQALSCCHSSPPTSCLSQGLLVIRDDSFLLDVRACPCYHMISNLSTLCCVDRRWAPGTLHHSAHSGGRCAGAGGRPPDGSSRRRPRPGPHPRRPGSPAWGPHDARPRLWLWGPDGGPAQPRVL